VKEQVEDRSDILWYEGSNEKILNRKYCKITDEKKLFIGIIVFK
jgi:hypothetical protein